jgi:molybdate transport system substrate-binding protein
MPWLLLLLACDPSDPAARGAPAPVAPAALHVLAAASLSDVLPAVAEAWREAGGATVTFSFDGTSRLAAQLAAGAPADLLFSADQAWMDDVAGKGLVRADSRVDLLGNRLVVVVPVAAAERPGGLADLPALPGKLALAGESVPAGRYAREALGNAGQLDAVTPLVVSGDSVRSVLAWVARGEAAAGVVYATDARVEPRVAVAFQVDEALHAPVRYPVAITTSSAAPEAAAAFLSWCAGPGRDSFTSAGFQVLLP